MKNDTRITEFYRRARRYWEDNRLIERDSKILVALSGGKDSVCMFKLLLKAREEMGLEISACHVHHGLRDQADDDASFCARLAESCSVPFFLCREDVKGYSLENKISLESAGRELRYRALERIARQQNAELIATAHTASDCAETQLMNFIRGSGLKGLAGIPPKRGKVIRPILFMTSEEVKEFLELDSQRHVTDKTNFEPFCRRNRIRLQVMELLKKENPDVERTLFRSGEILREENTLLTRLALRELERLSDDPLSYDKAALRRLCLEEGLTGLCSHLVRRAMELLGSDMPSAERCKAVENAALYGNAGQRIQLKNGFIFSVEQKRLVFSRELEKPCFDVVLCEETNLILPINAQIVVQKEKLTDKKENVNKKSMNMLLNSATICGVLRARSRREGDFVRINGMNKSLKKLLCDMKLGSDRDMLPIICDDEGILWVPGAGLADRARPKADDGVLKLEIQSTVLEKYFK